MLGVRYRGFTIEPTLAATRELLRYNKDLTDVLEILNKGYNCSASRRKANIIERCIRKDGKEIKVVVARTAVFYPDGYKEDVWRLIHFGMKSFKKR